MSLRSVSFISAALLLFAAAGVVEASAWENLFSGSSDGIEAKIELKKRTIRVREVRGEKIVSAVIRSYFDDSENRTTATGDYEVYCAARKVFRSNLTMEVIASDRTKSTIESAQRTLLEGQERQDFVAIMDMLCTR
ncbi:MAG: hypothetical protein AAF351_01925 [Pseudomonadota bacterium]